MSVYATVKQLVQSLSLSLQDAMELRELGDQFVQETLQQYLELSVDRKGVVDKHRWQEIRKKDDIRVYKERKSSLLKTTRMKGHLGEAHGGGFADLPTLPPLLVVGTVIGDLDDVMYATTTPSVDSMKIKTAYVEDGLVASKILQQLISPTPDDPFRNLAVKWCVVHPPKVQSLIRARDYVYVDSTGIVISPSGERIGYRITHSIAFAGVPTFEETHAMVRGNTSICCLYRQSEPAVVDCFVTGFFELHGDVMKSLALVAIAGQGMSFSKQVDCAHMKKLAWRLRQRQKRRRIFSGLQHQQYSGHRPADSCRVCSRTFVSSRTSRFLRGPITKKCCSLCEEIVCSKCRLKRRIFFIGSGLELVQQDLSFCAPCVAETARMDAYEIAKDEFFNDDAYGYSASSFWESPGRNTWSRSSGSSSSSGRHYPILLAGNMPPTTQSAQLLQVWEEDA